MTHTHMTLRREHSWCTHMDCPMAHTHTPMTHMTHRTHRTHSEFSERSLTLTVMSYAHTYIYDTHESHSYDTHSQSNPMTHSEITVELRWHSLREHSHTYDTLVWLTHDAHSLTVKSHSHTWESTPPWCTHSHIGRHCVRHMTHCHTESMHS